VTLADVTTLGLTDLPTDNPLNRVYRVGAAVIGIGLLVFGVLGYVNRLAFFDTAGDSVAGLSTNVLLSTISVVVGAALLVGAVVGGNLSAALNLVTGVLFLASGLVNLTLLRTDWNILNFGMKNVIFSFVAGLLLLTFGLYGRVTGGLPPDNPYYRGRHGLDPGTGEVVDEEKAGRVRVRSGDQTPVPRAADTGADPRQLT
jgi:membrane protein implicated in regulation of membrane protease activity